MASRRTRLAARRKMVGYSQERFAEAVGVDRTTVVRWESGETEPQPWHRRKVAAVLEVSLEQLEELLTAREDDVAQAVSGSGILPAQSPNLGNPPHGGSLHASDLSAIAPDALPQVAVALDKTPRYFDRTVVSALSQQLAHAKATDGRLGPAKALPLVSQLLSVIQYYTRDVKPAVRRELLRLGADAAEFTGWLYRDLRQWEIAVYWYDRAMEWAQEAGDFPMQSYVLLKKSQMAYDQRDGLRALTLAQAAQSDLQRLPHKVCAEVVQQEALGMAMLGEPLHDIEAKLETARVSLAKASADDDAPGSLGAYFNDGTLLLRSASCYTEAGKPRRAAAIFGDVVASGTLSRRDEGYFKARQAAALVLGGEPDHAATVALDSVRITKATDSARTRTVLKEVMQTLTPWSNRPAPREFREAMSA